LLTELSWVVALTDRLITSAPRSVAYTMPLATSDM
jgi:hypothetical protein